MLLRRRAARNCIRLVLGAGARPTSSTVPTSKPFFVTTPIYYCNSKPHLGHVFSSVIADCTARHARLAGQTPVLFSTGTDEYGQKVHDAAVAAGARSTLEFCDSTSALFESAAAAFGVSADAFVRTTSPAHRLVVEWLWQRLAARGALFLGEHSGWYCQSDEAFVAEAQTGTRREYLRRRELPLPPPGPGAADLDALVSLESGHPIEWLSEVNYRFRLSEYAPAVDAWLAGGEAGGGAPSPVFPLSRALEARTFIAAGLNDLSVSRRRDVVPWALPVPGDPGHSVYVWLDALSSYLTAALAPSYAASFGPLPQDAPWQELFPAWPPDVQVLGKDILRFHAVVWPALLAAAGLPLPRRLVVHGHWTVGRVKMSKSLGNVVDPVQLLRAGPPAYGPAGTGTGAAFVERAAGVPSAPVLPQLKVKGGRGGPVAPPPAPALPVPWVTADALRYFLLREGGAAMSGDADFSPAALHHRVVSECADSLGNLASRVLTRSLISDGCLPYAELCGSAEAVASLAAAGGGGGGSQTAAELVQLLRALRDTCGPAYAAGCPGAALEATVAAVTAANRVFAEAAPWALKKAAAAGDTGAQRQLGACLYLALEALRVVGTVLAPVAPLAAETLLGALGFRLASSESPGARRLTHHAHGAPAPLPGSAPGAGAGVGSGWAVPGGGAGGAGPDAAPLAAPELPLALWADAAFGSVGPAGYTRLTVAPGFQLFPKPPSPKFGT